MMVHEWTSGKSVPHELIDLLCNDFTGWEEADDDDYFALEAETMMDVLC